MKIACGTYSLIMQILLRLFFLVSQTLHICGKVVLLRGSPYEKNSQSSLKNLICLSEDDGGALVWNDIFTSESDFILSQTINKNKEFHNINVFTDNEINCKMNEDTDCLKSWNRLNWTLTNSVETPMGPVFDQRWENFKEYSNFGISFDRVKLKRQISSAGALSFSTRAPDNVHVLFCHTETFTNSFCFWIIIGGWKNKKSAIRKCRYGVSNASPKESPTYEECRILQASLDHIPLSETEWRTFVITWNFTESSQNVTVFDTDNRIVTHERKTNTGKFKHSNFNFIFIKTRSHMLLRFHEYDFLYTSIESAILTSPTFHLVNSVLCMQMIIGLCTECDAYVVILDNSNEFEVIENVTAKSSLIAAHNLPMWHFITLNKTLPTDSYRDVKIQVIPKLHAPSRNPLWAIADVRQCSEKESLRKGAILTTGISSRSWHSFSYSYTWPNVTCQKLFYNEHTVVSSLPQATTNTDLDDKDCPIGKIGPKCLFSCANDLKSYDNCRETAICYTSGCTCSPGFRDTECSYPCDDNLYGHNCKNMCGSCKTSTCDKVTGECIDGCVNILNKTYMPPLCQIGIDKLEAPSVISTATSIETKLRTIWKKEYEHLPIQYSFTLTGPDNYTVTLPWKNLFPNMTHMTGYFKDLKSGSFYWVKSILFVAKIRIESEWQNVETACDLAKRFVVTPAENSITINPQYKSDQFYPCPPNWYFLQLQYTSNIANHPIFTEIATKFPRELSGLKPCTSFDVTIYHAKYNNNTWLYFETVHTLEGVPTEVLDVRYLEKSNISVTLMWRSPDQPNGIILYYKVTLKIDKYCGCTDKNLNMPDNSTFITIFTNKMSITILDLHPYTSYKAQVTAHNSRHSSNGTEIMFSTEENDIPTETFTQVEFNNWILSWQSPKDCSTILGSLLAKIKINGVSYYVQNYTVIKQTKRKYIDLRTLNPPLNGAEQYKATVYVIREFNSKENSSAFQELYFKSPPTAPSAVTNLEVVEIDNRVSSNMMLYLKWHSPLPPLNGQLQYYYVTLCYTIKNCSSKIVELTNMCDLWNDYICEEFPISTIDYPVIKVFAYNKDVTTASPPAYVSRQMLENTKPGVPEEFTCKINDNSVVNLQWRHPWTTGRHLRCFRITIEEKISNLKKTRNLRSIRTIKTQEMPVEQYRRYYSESLHLFPSTEYRISIQSVTITNETSIYSVVELQTPSDASFDGNLQILKENSNSTIMLYIPPVLNDTLNSVMHIIVKGPDRCKDYSEVPKNLQEQANVKMYEIAWHAAMISTDEIARNNYTFLLGDDLSYGGAKNCALHPNQLYNITVIVKEQSSNLENSFKSLMLTKSINIGQVSSVHYETWLIPVILLFFMVAAGYYICQRRNKQSEKKVFLHDEIVLSENIGNYEYESKSVISSSKQDLTSSTFDKIPTPFDKRSTKSLSRATTPEISIVEIVDREKTLSVKVKEFEDYVREAIQSGLLEKQYETFPRGQTRPWNYGKLPQNKSKNRYGNLIAYDETRVILNKLPDDDYSDYINANYITGYKKPKHYIATQGPKPNTVVDFWRMIWQENVLIICMVANVIENGKTKCEQYWPDIGKKKKYGDIIVLNANHNVFADYCFRTFQVTCGEETRKIEHLHYTAWPDHGVPLYTHSVVTYLKKLLATPPGNGPVVVHCSAGVGRTGTIILCDICLHRAAAERVVDVFADTASIRNERANMVDNKQQYLLAHLALVECLLSIPTTLPCNETLPARIKELKAQLPAQQQRLQNIAWQDEALRPVTSPPFLSECNRAKNRFPELLSDKVSRIYLRRYPASDDDSDYLSAVYVDGVKLQNQYLATQLPMPSTVTDFWRMVAEFKVELILTLQPPDPQDPTCCAIVPTSGEFKPTPYLNITTKRTIELEYYTSQQLLLIDNSEKPSREQSVTILCLTQWKSGRNQPPPPVMTMVSFWQAAERIARGDGPTVILCHDGVTGCGLYLALSFLLERMAVERECDVCLAVRAVRRSRPDFVQSLEHLEYLCDAVITYLEYFETYANFS